MRRFTDKSPRLKEFEQISEYHSVQLSWDSYVCCTWNNTCWVSVPVFSVTSPFQSLSSRIWLCFLCCHLPPPSFQYSSWLHSDFWMETKDMPMFSVMDLCTWHLILNQIGVPFHHLPNPAGFIFVIIFTSFYYGGSDVWSTWWSVQCKDQKMQCLFASCEVRDMWMFW